MPMKYVSSGPQPITNQHLAAHTRKSPLLTSTPSHPSLAWFRLSAARLRLCHPCDPFLMGNQGRKGAYWRCSPLHHLPQPTTLDDMQLTLKSNAVLTELQSKRLCLQTHSVAARNRLLSKSGFSSLVFYTHKPTSVVFLITDKFSYSFYDLTLKTFSFIDPNSPCTSSVYIHGSLTLWL